MCERETKYEVMFLDESAKEKQIKEKMKSERKKKKENQKCFQNVKL